MYLQPSRMHVVTVAVLEPLQSDPPYAGDGLLQLLVLVIIPLPHVTEHDEFLQSPH